MQLKLKQASAVLGVSSKELQNLVQAGVLKPLRRGPYCWFDARRLLEAKVAFYLKESLGASTDVLVCFLGALSKGVSDEDWAQIGDLRLCSRPARGREAIEVRIPLRKLAREVDEQLPRAQLYRDLPRGRKRPAWKRQFMRTLEAASSDLEGVTSHQIRSAIQGYRAGRRGLPEITIARKRRTA